MSNGTKEMERLCLLAEHRKVGRPKLSFEWYGEKDEREAIGYVIEVGNLRARVDAGAGAIAVAALRLCEQLGMAAT